MAERTGALAEVEAVFAGAAEAEIATGNRHEYYGCYGCGSGCLSTVPLETGCVTYNANRTWSPW